MKKLIPQLTFAAILQLASIAHPQCTGPFCRPVDSWVGVDSSRLALDSQLSTLDSSAHCRIHVGDGPTASNFVGSGTLISKNNATGLVLTCSHLFDHAASDIVVTFPDGSRFGARLVDRDPANDLAAVLIRQPAAEPIAVGDKEIATATVLTACGYGGNGQFRPVTAIVSGAAQAVGATFPSLKIAGSVRPGGRRIGGGVAVAISCVNASLQHFTIAAPNISVPPVTFSIWLNTTSIVAANSALFHWRGSVQTGLLLRYFAPDWHIRYYVGNGLEFLTSTGHTLASGVWQHACLALTSTQARVYLDGAVFTNNVSHATASINDTGFVGRDPFPDANHTTFNGALAEPAIWNVALSHDECLALAKGFSPLALASRLSNLVLYRDLIRDPARGVGPALTPINAPEASAHPPIRAPQGRRPFVLPRATFVAPYRPAFGVSDGGRVAQGLATTSGVAAGVTLPIGEVSS